MKFWIDALTLFLLGSVLLFLTAVIQRRSQLPGLIFATLTLLAYVGYYGDREPFEAIHARAMLGAFGILPDADTSFKSINLISYLLAAVYIIRVIVYQRISTRRRLLHIGDSIANFTAGATFAILLGAIFDSLFHWGWIGSAIITLVLALVYLGAIGLFEGIIAVAEQLASYCLIKARRLLSGIAFKATKILAFFASLSQRLVPNLRNIAEQLRDKAETQRDKYEQQMIEEDQKLEDQHNNYQARQQNRWR